MDACFLHGHGSCSDRISREHYLSAAVLRAIAPSRDLSVGGFPWQDENTMQGIGIGSLQSKILCQTHNSILSPFDAEAGLFVETLIAADKNPTSLKHETEFDGPTIERWLLKVLLGASASRALTCAPLSANHKDILLGAEWPTGWGLYAGPSPEPEIFTQDVLLETGVNPTTRELMAASFRIAGIRLWLLLGKPDHPETYGIYRPRGLVFQNDALTRQVGLKWPDPSNDKAVIFTKLGVTTAQAPHTLGWRKKGESDGT